MDFRRGDMVRLPPGDVELRDARRDTLRTVSLSGFSISRTSVVPEVGDRPARGITWFDAIRVCNAFSRAKSLEPAYAIDNRTVRWDVTADGYRLPTEAEWEYACRAGTGGARYGELAAIAWTALDDVDGPQAVGGKEPIAFGLHDTLGNVWEWCWDYLDPARYGDYRVFRGGSWSDAPWSVRASVRRGSAPDADLDGTGFRVVRGAISADSVDAAQGWSDAADRERATLAGPLPVGWTPLRA